MTDIVSIVGDAPGSGCGVGDFVGVFNDNLRCRGASVESILIPRFGVQDLQAVRTRLREAHPKIIHLQFPSASLGKSPWVSFLPLTYRNAPWIVTVCEFSTLNPIRQATLMPMLYLFDGYIFTTPNELDYAQRFRPFNRLNSRIIPAVSNIPFLSDKSSSAPLRNPALVAYFGQIVPNKGLEDFLELVSLSRSSSAPLDFLIVGATPDWARNYWEAIVSRATKLQCELKLNLAAADVSRELARATFGYFPYPDGACLKRGTLPAAIEHGLILITKWGEKTEPDVKAVTIRADNARSAFNEILQISSTPTKLDQIIRARTQFNSKYSTSAIIDGYLSFYKSLIGSSLFRLENPQDKPSPVS